MEQMEEGKENSTEDVNIENVDNIICHEELQPEVINTEIDQSIEDICTIQDSKDILCQGILMDILVNIFNVIHFIDFVTIATISKSKK